MMNWTCGHPGKSLRDRRFINRTIINTVCNDRRVSRGYLAAQTPGRPENVVCLSGHGLGSRRTNQDSVLCTAGKHDSQVCSDVKQSRNALSSREGGLGAWKHDLHSQGEDRPSYAGEGDACQAGQRRGACGQHRHGTDFVKARVR